MARVEGNRNLIARGVFAGLMRKTGCIGNLLAASDRKVTLIQTVVSKDGVLTGKFEQLSVNADGTVKDETIPLDGAASGHDLIFKPTSVWFGGLQASGAG